MLEMTPFSFDGSVVRALMLENEPWFVARDVCDVLDLENVTKAVSGLDVDELALLKVRSGGQEREMNCVSESGLYTLIIRSNKPQAKPFRRWVTREVLPSIRKTGSYSTSGHGKRSDIFHHRGPVSKSGLDIRYTLDLTKIVQRPTAASMGLLQRVTGVDLEDLIAASGTSPIADLADNVRAFCAQSLVISEGDRVRLSAFYEELQQWLRETVGTSIPVNVRTVATMMRDSGYTLEKIGGAIWILDCWMGEDI